VITQGGKTQGSSVDQKQQMSRSMNV